MDPKTAKKAYETVMPRYNIIRQKNKLAKTSNKQSERIKNTYHE